VAEIKGDALIVINHYQGYIC